MFQTVQMENFRNQAQTKLTVGSELRVNMANGQPFQAVF